MKKIIIPLFLVFAVVAGAVTYIASVREKPCLSCEKNADKGTTQDIKFSDYFADNTDLCNVLDKVTVSNLLGKTIVRTESKTGNTLKSCHYYLDETHALVINYDLTAVDSKLKGHESMGRKITTNPKIIARHAVVVQENGLINEIYLISGDNQYVSINRTSEKTISGEEMVNFAAKLGELVSGIVPLMTSSTSGQTKSDSVPLPQMDDHVRNFLLLIDEKSPSEAVSMLSSTITSNDALKQAWAVQFNAIDHMRVVAIEPADPGDWLADKQMYKLTLDVEMNPESVSAPIPYYGWNNGTNTRWITIVKENNLWKIKELATGP